jgi:transposase
MDARTLEPSALYLLRRQAVRAVRGGMSQTDAARTFEASLRAISKWRRLNREGGLRALKRRDRRPGEGRRNAKRVAHIRSLIVGKLPDQLTLPSYLWTRAAVASLIAREYGIAVLLVTVGRYLRAWGLSPQKPVWRAYERNDAAIARWLKREYPAIAR